MGFKFGFQVWLKEKFYGSGFKFGPRRALGPDLGFKFGTQRALGPWAGSGFQVWPKKSSWAGSGFQVWPKKSSWAGTRLAQEELLGRIWVSSLA